MGGRCRARGPSRKGGTSSRPRRRTFTIQTSDNTTETEEFTYALEDGALRLSYEEDVCYPEDPYCPSSYERQLLMEEGTLTALRREVTSEYGVLTDEDEEAADARPAPTARPAHFPSPIWPRAR